MPKIIYSTLFYDLVTSKKQIRSLYAESKAEVIEEEVSESNLDTISTQSSKSVTTITPHETVSPKSSDQFKNIQSLAPPKMAAPVPTPEREESIVRIRSESSESGPYTTPLAESSSRSRSSSSEPPPVQKLILPPEEFSDVDLVIKEEPDDNSNYAITVNTPPPSEFLDKAKEKKPLKKTLRRTRKFVVDGVEMQVTTEKAIRNAENAKKIKRKQRNFILRELKVLHSMEQKEMSNLSMKLSSQMDNMMSNFENERNAIMYKFSQELEAMTSQQKRKIEELEFSQELDERKTIKTLKRDQERVTKEFKRTLRKERSEFKNTIPRSTPRKTVIEAEAELDEKQRSRETEHYAKLNLMLNDSKNTIKAKYFESMKKYEKMFLKDRLDVTMTREEQIWEMEKRQLHTKHQTLKEHMKEQYWGN